MRTSPAAVTAIALGTLLSVTGSVGVAAQRSSAGVLSEHEIEVLDSTPPQAQAELLLERSVNRFQGANEQIKARLELWAGKIKSTPRLENLFQTAINSDDMRVRVAGLEVNLLARHLEKTSATIDRLEPIARSGEQGARVNALWNLGLLGNRGVHPERVFDILMASLHDPNENIRYWAVEGLAYLGTNETIAPLLGVFHDDPSSMIRERGACSLAQSGMLDAKQRKTAVPRLLDFAEDYGLDSQTRGWVFQALRDITGQSLPPNAGAWRHWYNFSGQK